MQTIKQGKYPRGYTRLLVCVHTCVRMKDRFGVWRNAFTEISLRLEQLSRNCPLLRSARRLIKAIYVPMKTLQPIPLIPRCIFPSSRPNAEKRFTHRLLQSLWFQDGNEIGYTSLVIR